MQYNVISEFYSERPVVICTGDSCVVCANPAASAKLRHIAEGEKLFDHMEPLDVLKYRAMSDACASVKPFVFGLSGYYGFERACAVFEQIMGRRFATVALYKSGEEVCPPESLSQMESNTHRPEEVSRFLSCLSSVPAEIFGEDDRVAMLDLRETAKKCISEIMRRSSRIDCTVEYEENEELSDYACFPVRVGLPNFMKMTAALLHAANDISYSGKLYVKLCRYGEEGEIRITTDTVRLSCGADGLEAIIDELPSSAVYLTVCDYIAGCSDCTLDAEVSERGDRVTLILTFAGRYPHGADFKSRDQFKYFDALLSETLEQFERL